jgi:sugar lactone lactonase YvrE
MTNSYSQSPSNSVLPLDKATVLYDGTVGEQRLPHPEGVAIGPDGWIWCGSETGQLFRIRPDGGEIEQVASTGGFILGLAFGPDNTLYLCDLQHACVFKYHISSAQLTRFTEPGIRIPNYPVVDAARACLYVSDSFESGTCGPGVWRYDLHSGAGELWYEHDMNFANGMALSPDGKTLYVVETFACKVSTVTIDEVGRATFAQVYVDDLPGYPDGIAFDDQGTLFVACYEPSRILRVTPERTVDVYIEDPTAHLLCHPTNIAFDQGTLYSANLGRWHITRIESDTQAQPLCAQFGSTKN